MDIYDTPTNDGKDYVLQIKVKNGPLLRAMRMRGYHSNIALAEAAKVAYSTLCSYLSLRLAPITPKGWRGSALRLAKCLKLPPDALFPEQHLERALAKASGEMEVSREEMVALFDNSEDDPESRLITAQVSEKVDEILNTLPERDKKIIELSLGLGDEEPHTLREISERMDISIERVRQIIRKGLEKFKQTKNIRALAKAGSDDAMDYIERHNGSTDFMFEVAPLSVPVEEEKEVKQERQAGQFQADNEKLNAWARELAEQTKRGYWRPSYDPPEVPTPRPKPRKPPTRPPLVDLANPLDRIDACLRMYGNKTWTVHELMAASKHTDVGTFFRYYEMIVEATGVDLIRTCPDGSYEA